LVYHEAKDGRPHKSNAVLVNLELCKRGTLSRICQNPLPQVHLQGKKEGEAKQEEMRI